MYASLEEQLLARVEKVPYGCWLFKGSLRSGYGRIQVNKKLESVHRISWIIYRGPIPEGLFVLHHCDVRNCINPDHLFLGTKKDNYDDMYNKGRSYQQSKNIYCSRGHTMDDAYTTPQGKRMCRTCKNVNYMNWYYRNGDPNVRQHNSIKTEQQIGWIPQRKINVE